MLKLAWTIAVIICRSINLQVGKGEKLDRNVVWTMFVHCRCHGNCYLRRGGKLMGHIYSTRRSIDIYCDCFRSVDGGVGSRATRDIFEIYVNIIFCSYPPQTTQQWNAYDGTDKYGYIKYAILPDTHLIFVFSHASWSCFRSCERARTHIYDHLSRREWKRNAVLKVNERITLLFVCIKIRASP